MACVCRMCGWSKDIPEDYLSWPGVVSNADIYPITSTGTASGTVIGFICAKCLTSATHMRLHVKAMLSSIEISEAALKSFTDYGAKIGAETDAVTLLRLYNAAIPIRFASPAVRRRFYGADGDVECRYNAGWVFVATTTSPVTILVAARAAQGELGRGFSYVGDVPRGAKRATRKKTRSSEPRYTTAKTLTKKATRRIKRKLAEGIAEEVRERRAHEDAAFPTQSEPHEFYGQTTPSTPDD